MKIEDCKTVPEFFGVYQGDHIWIEGNLFVVEGNRLRSDFDYLSAKIDSQALVGCLTGQLEWSTVEPMTGDEEDLLREIAARFPDWDVLEVDGNGDIFMHGEYQRRCPLKIRRYGSKAYTVLAPILEKYGEINLEDYR